MSPPQPTWREGLQTWSALLDGVTRRIGTFLACLLLLLVLLVATMAVARAIFGVASFPFHNAVTLIGAAVMLGGSGYALLMDEHLRVGQRYRQIPSREQALISMIGLIAFLLPMLTVLLWATGLAVVNGIKALHGDWSNLSLFVVFNAIAFLGVFAVGVQAQSAFLRAWLRR